jgi:hypothetical protein
VVDELTKVLVGLYEEPEKPNDAMHFIKRHLGSPGGVDGEQVREENDSLKAENETLRKQVEELRAALAKAGISDPVRPPVSASYHADFANP